MSRRQLLRLIAGASASIPSASLGIGALAGGRSEKPSADPGSTAPPGELSESDREFLGELEKAVFLYFWEQANPR
jgi:hypothetical protein